MLTKPRSSLGFALLSLTILAVLPSHASTIFTSFGAVDSYTTTPGSFLNVTGESQGSYNAVASPFTPTGDYNVKFIDLLLGSAGDGTDATVDVGLYSDSSDSPGSLLEVLSPVTVSAVLGDTAPAVYTADVTGDVPVVAGTQYWVVVLPSAMETFDGWFYNSPGTNAPYATSSGGSAWTESSDNPQLYFDVEGDLTSQGSSTPPGNLNLPSNTGAPEPGTLALLGLGLSVLAAQRRQRSR